MVQPTGIVNGVCLHGFSFLLCLIVCLKFLMNASDKRCSNLETEEEDVKSIKLTFLGFSF